MFITKKHLSRRLMLRGMGVTLALPLLDSMIPAQTPLARTAASGTLIQSDVPVCASTAVVYAPIPRNAA